MKEKYRHRKHALFQITKVLFMVYCCVTCCVYVSGDPRCYVAMLCILLMEMLLGYIATKCKHKQTTAFFDVVLTVHRR